METTQFPYNSPLHMDSSHFLGYLLRQMWLRWRDNPDLLQANTTRVQELLSTVDPWERETPFSVYAEALPTNDDAEPPRPDTSDAVPGAWCHFPRQCPAAFRGWNKLVQDISPLRDKIPLFPGDALFDSELENGGRSMAMNIIEILDGQQQQQDEASHENLEQDLSKAFAQALRISPGYKAVRLFVRCHRACHRTQSFSAQEIESKPGAGCLMHEATCTPGRGHASFSLPDPLQVSVWREVARAQRQYDKKQNERTARTGDALLRERQRAMFAAAAAKVGRAPHVRVRKSSNKQHPSRLDKLRDKIVRHKLVSIV
jgi:hypothetical protein